MTPNQRTRAEWYRARIRGRIEVIGLDFGRPPTSPDPVTQHVIDLIERGNRQLVRALFMDMDLGRGPQGPQGPTLTDLRRR